MFIRPHPPFSLASSLVFFLFLPFHVNCYPLLPRKLAPSNVDPSSDAWAETLSGIGPLILLVGERSTKQLLRCVRDFYTALSIGTAPIGLLTVITGLIRFCGIQQLRTFIGYELEARTVAGVEYTQVNCGGVHAELLDGYLVRSTGANPASQAVALSYLQGPMNQTFEEAKQQIEACSAFGRYKIAKGVPNDTANLRWVLCLACKEASNTTVALVIKHLMDTLELEQRSGILLDIDGYTQRILQRIELQLGSSGQQMTDESVDTIRSGIPSIDRSSTSKELSATVKDFIVRVTTVPSDSGERVEKYHDEETLKSPDMIIYQDKTDTWKVPQLSFMYNLDAVSEFLTCTPVSRYQSFGISIISCFAILALYILALWAENWDVNIAWLLMIVGYAGIVVSVTSAGMIISSGCTILQLQNRSRSGTAWVDGVVNSVKNTDSMDTTGSAFFTSKFGPQIFEAVWMRPLGSARALLASTTSIMLVAFFVCHYLGLRSSRWWVAVGELGVCVFAAFARSLAKGRQEKFDVVKGIKIDKRCCSTGLITTQKSHKILSRSSRNIDGRAYSAVVFKEIATDGESIAWHAAQLCFKHKDLCSRLFKLTGMIVQAVKSPDNAGECAIMVSFDGGLVVSEGLAFPATRVCLAFRSSISALALPTALLARGLMRQPEWVLDKPGFGPFPLGAVYILSINSMMSWWTLSEDRNDMADLQKNLQWCFVMINISFFISLMQLQQDKGFPTASLEMVHSNLSEDNRATAEKVFEFLQLEK